MINDHDKSDESEDDHSFEDIDDLINPLDNLDSIRLDIVEKVFKRLSADAQRGDNALQRNDVNRAYIRKQLSVAECMGVEELLVNAGYQIREEDEEESGKDAAPKSIHRYLSETEERDLGRRIQLAQRLPEDTSTLDSTYIDRVLKDAERAKATFVASNVRYVEHLARRMGEHKHLSLEDIKQEGFIGLLHAANLYDPERGFRFKTYATWWIDQRMRRAVANLDRTIRLPVHIQEKMVRIKRAKAKLTLTRGSAPTQDELAKAIGMDSEKLMALLWRVQTTDCADGDVPIADDATLLSVVADSAESTFDMIVSMELKERFRNVLATLTPREARVVRMRFGIDLDQDYTLESVAQRYDLTRERIRQIEAKALAKLRHPVRSEKLSDFLDT